jgi:hypothetical protein
MYIYASLVLYSCFTSLDIVTAAILFYFHIFMYTSAFLVLYSYWSWCVCVCVPAYWASRVRAATCGAEERGSMGAWHVAADGSW